MIEVLKITGYALWKSEWKFKKYKDINDTGERAKSNPILKALKELSRAFEYHNLVTDLLLLEPYKGRKSRDVHMSLLVEEDCWLRIHSNEILQIQYDEDILMVTTFKGSKSSHIFVLEEPFDPSMWHKLNIQPSRFSFGDFENQECLLLDKDECLKTSYSYSFNMAIYHYLKFIQEFPTISLEMFKEWLNNGWIGLCDVCQEDMLKNSIERHKCKSCSKPCMMKCSRCLETMYCDQECQLSDWEKHRTMCDKFTQDRGVRRKIGRQFDEFLKKRMEISSDITFKKFYSLQRKKIRPRAIEYFPEETPEMTKDDEVD